MISDAGERLVKKKPKFAIFQIAFGPRFLTLRKAVQGQIFFFKFSYEPFHHRDDIKR